MGKTSDKKVIFKNKGIFVQIKFFCFDFTSGNLFLSMRKSTEKTKNYLKPINTKRLEKNTNAMQKRRKNEKKIAFHKLLLPFLIKSSMAIHTRKHKTW